MLLRRYISFYQLKNYYITIHCHQISESHMKVAINMLHFSMLLRWNISFIQQKNPYINKLHQKTHEALVVVLNILVKVGIEMKLASKLSQVLNRLLNWDGKVDAASIWWSLRLLCHPFQNCYATIHPMCKRNCTSKLKWKSTLSSYFHCFIPFCCLDKSEIFIVLKKL